MQKNQRSEDQVPELPKHLSVRSVTPVFHDWSFSQDPKTEIIGARMLTGKRG